MKYSSPTCKVKTRLSELERGVIEATQTTASLFSRRHGDVIIEPLMFYLRGFQQH